MALHQKIFFFLLVFLSTQLGFHFWPAWAFVLGRRVDYLSPTIYLTDVLIFFILSFWCTESKKRMRELVVGIMHNTRYVMPVAIFVFLNIFFSANQWVAIYKWLKVLEFVGLGWYVIKTKSKISFVLLPLSIAVFYSSILAIAQFVLQHSVGLWILGERTFSIDTPGVARVVLGGREFLRAYATFPHPNVLGGFLAATLPLVYYLQIYNSTNLQIKEKILKTFQWTTLLLGLTALFLTFSRSAWVAGALGFSIQYLVFRKKTKLLIPLMLTTIAVILILGKTINAQDESFVVRQQLNTSAISMWQTSPLSGVGLGNFLVTLPKYLVSRDVYFLQPVHNIYLLVLAETGIIGFILFLILLWSRIKGFVSGIRQKKNAISVIRNTKYVSLFLFLLLGLIDHYPISLQQGQLLLTILLVLQ